MKLIVGLGNPGGNYESTRHNIGFMIADKLANELGSVRSDWQSDSKHNALVAKAGEVLLVKPQTFMNNSGSCVQSLLRYYHLQAQDVWVVHDDMDLPLGKIRIREKGASAGHNGVDSIIKSLKTDAFVRFRMGIGRGKEAIKRNTDQNLHHRSVIHFVLSRFRLSEAGDMRKLIKYGTQAVRMALHEGIDRAMNRYN